MLLKLMLKQTLVSFLNHKGIPMKGLCSLRFDGTR